MIDSSFTIGITGNIATGKSVIRHMLANAGLFGLDADSIANRMLFREHSPTSRCWMPLVQRLKPSRVKFPTKFGQIVFNDQRIRKLEALVHPR